ncbi:hypothetical protein ABWED_2691 [Acinetobacter lwoffii]|nr:hypothetical protein ABWED_2691 [Acinetobacter lwoffii]
MGNNSERTSLGDLCRQFLLKAHEIYLLLNAQHSRSNSINMKKIGDIVAEFQGGVP